ncbi:MAG: glycoside hydrolase family 15 protein [Thiotrichales bacterium]|nr:glycoside hydrolase family 15 protein [Thiotrichales bacterium]
MASLNLGVIGNCTYGALVDENARIVWCCLPRFDADPVFCRLIDDAPRRHRSRPDPSETGSGADVDAGAGFFAIELLGVVEVTQSYRPNTAILETRMADGAGNRIVVTDFAPRFQTRGRTFRPTTLVRRVRAISGSPRIRVRVRPRFNYGARAPDITHGSNHIRYAHTRQALRLNTNAPITYVLDETPFLLEEPVSLLLGPDETLAGGVEPTAREFEEKTETYWRRWTRRLALPFEWQEAVSRAAITLKLCAFEETGAIIAAMTTSIPEAADTERNWDYRYCWLRDSFFVVRALNSLAEVETMEDYLRYLNNLISGNEAENSDGHLQPVFGIGLERRLTERTVTSLAGYRGMGPVRAGNQAFEHIQHDVYGNVVLAASQAFFDTRLLARPGRVEFERLERIGERAFAVHDQPDAGMWELRTMARVHSSSSLMCWAACDRLAKIAAHLGLAERCARWCERATTVRATILERAWNPHLGAFAESFEGDGLDASLLLMAEVGFIDSCDARFRSTVVRIEQELRRGNHLFRYATADDFGTPHNAFNICTFWYIDALARLGRREEAREIFDAMLDARNPLGLLSEDIDPSSGELWGNYPQTYSLVGIINAATRLSESWEDNA